MKESKYNIYYQVCDGLIICNTVTSAVLFLNKEYQNNFKQFQENQAELKEDLKAQLEKGGMIVPDETNETQIIKFRHMKKRLRHDNLSLTIAPTLDCNFRCPYCYEKGVEHIYMNDDTINQLFEFVKNYNKEKLSVMWYGGEPTLCLDIIEKLSDLFIDHFGQENYIASIVTNGYLLNRQTAIKLKEKKVTYAQITIDGPKSYHDKRRFYKDGTGTFDTILDNIKEIYDIITVVIRINVDKSNIDSTIQLLEHLKSEGILDKIRFYIAPVSDINSIQKNHNCFNQKEFSKYELFIYKHFKKYHPIKPPISTFGVCGAISMDSFVVSSDGKLYKCWDEIGRCNQEIGDIFKGITNNQKYIQWLSYHIDSYNKKCEKCKYLSTCFGGCPYLNMIEQDSEKCISFSYNENSVINQLYDDKNEKKTKQTYDCCQIEEDNKAI